jgi:superfamily II DNA or RNA helicase
MTSHSELRVKEVAKGRGLVLSPQPVGFLRAFKSLPTPKIVKGKDYYFEVCPEAIEHFSLRFKIKLYKFKDEPSASDVKSISEDDFNFKTEPYSHQIMALDKARGQRFFAYLMEMGTGKSKTLIDEAFSLWHSKNITALVVLAPNGVHAQWEDQLYLHLHNSCPRDIHVWKKGRVGSKAFKALNLLSLDGRLKVVTMNIEAIRGSGGKFLSEFLDVHSNALVAIDESSRIKNPRAQQTKAAHKIGDAAKFKRIMSGTAITQGVEDLWSQFRFLNQGLLGKSYYAFRGTYCKLFQIPGAPMGAMKITGYKNLDDLRERIDPHTFAITKKECLDLPAQIYMEHVVPLTAQQEKLYKQVKEEFFILLNDETFIDAALALTQMTKMQQIICGHLRDGEGGVHDLDTNRISELQELIDATPGKVIVWSRFVPDIRRIAASLKDKVVLYYGERTKDQRLEAIDQFVNGDAKVFVGQQQAGGLGLNLQVASTVIYFSNSFSLEHRLQSEARAHRIGTTEKVLYIDMVARGTLDEKVTRALRAKQSVASMTLGQLQVILK